MSSRNPRRSADRWSEIIAEYRASSEDDAAFCQRRQLNVATFRKHKYAVNKTLHSPAPGSGFTEVTLKPVVPSGLIRVQSRGVRVDLPVSVDIDMVVHLARALQHEG
jgi:hypothetical protein